MKKRTFFVFKTKDEQRTAIDILLAMRIKFTYNLKSANYYFISIAPKIALKKMLDLYLFDYVNYFSKIY